LGCYAQITSQKGVYGLLDGFFPWGAMIAIGMSGALLARAEWCGNGYAVPAGKGAVFAFGHAGAKKMLDGHMPGQMAEIVAGGVGGFVQVSKCFDWFFLSCDNVFP
jgi:hypothetical protein